MKWEAENIEDLIAKFIVGEASEVEIRELNEWCSLSPENQKYLDDSVFIYENAQLPDQQDFDGEKAWDKVKSEISKKNERTRLLIPAWGIAASLLLVLAFSFLFYRQYSKSEEFQFVSENQVLTQTLPDQTEVSLNQNSTVKVEYNERKKTGVIHVSGEVLINIPESKKVEWRVQTANLLIQDIGTIFNVKAFPKSETVEVTVQEGIVKFYSQSQEGIILQAGEKGIYDKSTNTFFKAEADPNVTAYKTRNFSFYEQELQLVIDQLSQIYGRKINLDGNIGQCKLTVDFENEELETILSIIGETMSLDITYDSNQIRISGEGCF
ncbi:FecR family protein [Algoriphagus sp.]|uniref:FecR family protein n=1 Tax=Algoriphagus sp. TaxID=1872435 RepID=UPI0039189F78